MLGLMQIGLEPQNCRLALQIDILVVNCSLFNPTPSLSAMIINHFKMRSNIVSYNLGGMGCSAGVIAISLAKELLQVKDTHKGSFRSARLDCRCSAGVIAISLAKELLQVKVHSKRKQAWSVASEQ